MILAAVASTSSQAAPLAEKFLLDGQLDEGAKQLSQHLQAHGEDDQARFGLGVVQFFASFEHLGTSLHEHGLRSERVLRGIPPEFRKLLTEHPNPKQASYENVREILQTWVDDLNRAEATLAGVRDAQVKLPLHVGQIKVDLLGTGNPISALILVGESPSGSTEDMFRTFVIAFDRGDVAWLRGYCHFLAAIGEAALAIDGRELFERTGHLFFANVKSPHEFLLEEAVDLDGFSFPLIADVISFIHLWRFPVEEPKRMQASLEHLEAMLAQSQVMWKFYQAEEDDDREWIPNPKQTGVLQVAVSQEMVDTWLATVREAELILQGKKLVPFWRGEPGKRGLNVRRIFTDPRTIDPILWVQGTSATPYLEQGDLTDLANPNTLREINDAFGGIDFFGFAFWFN
jgi:hypothetical protein